MIMTCETMKVKRYTDKVLVNCCRNARDLVISPTTTGFTPHSIRAEKRRVIERQPNSSRFFQETLDGKMKKPLIIKLGKILLSLLLRKNIEP